MLMVLSIPRTGATMRNMSVLELLFALLLVCLLAGIAFVGALVWGLGRRTESHVREVADLKARLDAGGQAQESRAAELRDRLSNTQSALEGVRSALAARQSIEEEARASLKPLGNVIAGSPSRRSAGAAHLPGAVRHPRPRV